MPFAVTQHLSRFRSSALPNFGSSELRLFGFTLFTVHCSLFTVVSTVHSSLSLSVSALPSFRTSDLRFYTVHCSLLLAPFTVHCRYPFPLFRASELRLFGFLHCSPFTVVSTVHSSLSLSVSALRASELRLFGFLHCSPFTVHSSLPLSALRLFRSSDLRFYTVHCSLFTVVSTVHSSLPLSALLSY